MQRQAGVDALRAALTLLVLFHHTAITYGAIGGWFYHEVPAGEGAQSKPLILFCTVNQAFFMGLFFLIAGSFTPGAFTRHGAWPYVRERLRRLGLPLLAFVLVLGPLTAALGQSADGTPISVTLGAIWRHHVFINGPLWFAQALLIFSVAYAVWRLAGRPAPVPRPFPTNLTLALAMLVTGAGAFVLRLRWPVGESVYGLQIAYFASYIVLFAAGCAGAASGWLHTVPALQRRVWGAIAAVALPVLPAAVILAPHVAALRGGDTSGGWNPQAAIYAFWEPLVAWGIILGLLSRFARVRTLGPVWTRLSRRAFAIYIIHPPILVAIALAWRRVPAPHLLKFAVTGTATCIACYLVAGLLLRVPAIRNTV